MSSLVYLGLSLILFVIVFGLSILFTPMILGVVFSLMDTVTETMTIDAEWLAIYEENEDMAQFMVPLIPGMGIIIIVIKVLMSASARGRD